MTVCLLLVGTEIHFTAKLFAAFTLLLTEMLLCLCVCVCFGGLNAERNNNEPNIQKRK